MAYDIFISYRRTDGSGLTSGTDIARTIKQQLEIEGYKNRVFFDYSELSDDEFEQVILTALEQCKVFILVLTKDSMMRCVNEGDWVRREILHAQKCGLKIIPVEPDNLFNGYPKDFPAELNVVKRVQHSKIHMDSSFERDMRAMIDMRIRPVLPKFDWRKPLKWIAVVACLLLAVWGGMEFMPLIQTRINTIQEQRAEEQRIAAEADSIRVVRKQIKADSIRTAQERMEAEKIAVEKAAKEKAEAERIAQEKAEAERFAQMDGNGLDGVYQVGDYYNQNGKEGVVFEISDNGRHGKIISLQQSKKSWCSEEEFKQKNLTGASDWKNGMNNQRIIQQISGWRAKYPAFAYCAVQGEGWYLPAIEELTLFANNNVIRDAVNRTLEAKGKTKLSCVGEYGYYWSSTENNEITAWPVHMIGGLGGYGTKTADEHYYVRAVAQF